MIQPLPDPDALAALLSPHPRVLFVGASGRGKSTALCALAQQRGAGCAVLCADPGQPAFGPPGAISLGRWREDAWVTEVSEGLGTLDALRFRLPLVAAAARLMARIPVGPLLVDAPGVYRGAVAAELVVALVLLCRADAAVVLSRSDEAAGLVTALAATPATVFHLRAHPEARDVSTAARVRRRSDQWRGALPPTAPRAVSLSEVAIVGTPPPLEDPEQWPGRQVVLLGAAGETLAMGEVQALGGGQVVLQAPPTEPPTALLIRDARWVDGALRTVPALPPPVRVPSPRRGEPIPMHLGPGATLGGASASLLGGLFEDPALHIRLKRQQQSLLFDVGENPALTRKLAHQLRAVFVTHAHQDHFGGFTRLVRGRTDRPVPCEVFGPPGLADRVAGFVDGFTWDRIGSSGCVFRVGELHGDRLKWFEVRAGKGAPTADGEVSCGGVLVADPLYTVRAITLDHAGLPVLAFSFEWTRMVSVNTERMVARRLPAGPWLAELRRRYLAEDDGVIALPDGTEPSVQALGDELITVRDGPRLVYATDLGDTPANRAALSDFARGASVLVCEASFREADAARARKTGHLTGRACGEIAAAAGVAALAPFHVSARYEDEPVAALAEVAAAFGDAGILVLPPSLDVRP